jgi:hypothetical protein
VVGIVLLGLLMFWPAGEPSACDRWQAEYFEAEARLDREVEPGYYVVPPPASKAFGEVGRKRPKGCPFP